MTRKRRKTRSRQERRRIHARTRQTLEQAMMRDIEVQYEWAMRPYPFLELLSSYDPGKHGTVRIDCHYPGANGTITIE